MEQEFWDEMRSEDFLLVDAPKRKIAIYANTSGQIIFAVSEDDAWCVTTICADEFNDFARRFNAAREIAAPKDAEIEADYAIYCAKTGASA